VVVGAAALLGTPLAAMAGAEEAPGGLLGADRRGGRERRRRHGRGRATAGRLGTVLAAEEQAALRRDAAKVASVGPPAAHGAAEAVGVEGELLGTHHQLPRRQRLVAARAPPNELSESSRSRFYSSSQI